LIFLESRVDDWSAFCVGENPATGEHLIVVNPRHHSHRQKVSLMEEVVHLVLDHPPTRLTQDASGRWHRSHDSDIEDEAFCVGAACIIPYQWLFNHVQNGGVTVAEIAGEFQVSEEYVKYRVKRAGLTAMFKKRCGPL
jgi:Zn-dependent peptidase ImmA (M78 family)